jgi:hypothetical protein
MYFAIYPLSIQIYFVLNPKLSGWNLICLVRQWVRQKTPIEVERFESMTNNQTQFIAYIFLNFQTVWLTLSGSGSERDFLEFQAALERGSLCKEERIMISFFHQNK